MPSNAVFFHLVCRLGMMAGMDLRLLRTFQLVARTGTVSAAAETLRVTQPALSRQVRQLERELGFDLFTRDRGRLVLSSAGRRFLEASEQILAGVSAAESLAGQLRAGRLTRLIVAAPTTTLTDVLAPFLATFYDDDPLTTVEEADFAAALDGLRSGVDLAIVTSPPPDGLASRRIAVLPIWAYVPADHHFARLRQISVGHLAGLDLVVLRPGPRPRQLIDEAMIDEGVAPGSLIECGNPQVAQALAAAGRGVAVVSDDPRFGLVPLRIALRDGRFLTLTLHAAWRPDHHAAEQLARMAARLSQFCGIRYGV
jgi:DNA-binding transcriptional LysR family regulator